MAGTYLKPSRTLLVKSFHIMNFLALMPKHSGVSTIFHVKDILNVDRFWNEQLRSANKDRLFGCFIDDSRSSVNGTYGHRMLVHPAITILRIYLQVCIPDMRIRCSMRSKWKVRQRNTCASTIHPRPRQAIRAPKKPMGRVRMDRSLVRRLQTVDPRMACPAPPAEPQVWRRRGVSDGVQGLSQDLDYYRTEPTIRRRVDVAQRGFANVSVRVELWRREL
jgi:hypothetical protein